MTTSDDEFELKPLNVKSKPLVRVRFASTIPDIVTEFGPAFTTSTLKDLIRDSRPLESRNRVLRIIYLGKILQDDVPLLDVLRPGQDELVVQCSIGATFTQSSSSTATAATPTAAELSSSSSQEDSLRFTTPAPRGFDRLRGAGLSAEEVADLRAQFNASRGRDEDEYTVASAAGGGPDQLDADLSAEEAWIDNDVHETRDASGAMYWDVLVGCCIGFFFGFGALFWVFGLGTKVHPGLEAESRDRQAGEVVAQQRTRIFSEKKTVAIFAGLLFNLLYGLCRT